MALQTILCRPLREIISQSVELCSDHVVEEFWISSDRGQIRASAFLDQVDDILLLPSLDSYARHIVDSAARARLYDFEILFSCGQSGRPVRQGYRSPGEDVAPDELFAELDSALYRHIVTSCPEPWPAGELVWHSFDFWSPRGVPDLELVVGACDRDERMNLPVPTWAGDMWKRLQGWAGGAYEFCFSGEFEWPSAHARAALLHEASAEHDAGMPRS